jgi:hypothetical protein
MKIKNEITGQRKRQTQNLKKTVQWPILSKKYIFGLNARGKIFVPLWIIKIVVYWKISLGIHFDKYSHGP